MFEPLQQRRRKVLVSPQCRRRSCSQLSTLVPRRPMAALLSADVRPDAGTEARVFRGVICHVILPATSSRVVCYRMLPAAKPALLWEESLEKGDEKQTKATAPRV